MGQIQGSGINPLLQDWHRHQIHPNLYMNRKTGDSAEEHIVMVKKSEESVLYKRMHENHKFVAPILYYEPVDKGSVRQDQQNFRVFVQKLDPLSATNWASVQSALAILKGYRRLSMTYGFLRVTPGMIGVNSKKEIRVWINEHSAANSQQYSQVSEEALMIEDISRVVKKLDLKTGTIIEKCASVHEAISAILHSMTNHMGTKPSFYNKSQKNEDSKSVLMKSNDADNKNNFRSTKQTEDNQLKSINQTEIGKALQNGIIRSHHKPYIYYPKSINNGNILNGQDSKSLSSSRPHKICPPNLQNNQNIKQIQLFNDSNASGSTLKPSSFPCNSTYAQPERILDQSTRSVKPLYIQKKPITPTNSQLRNYQTFNGNLTPTNSRPIKEASKFKQMLHQEDRSCNKYTVNNNRTEKSQKHFNSNANNFHGSQLIKSHIGARMHQKSQVDTARQLAHQSKSHTIIKPNSHPEYSSTQNQWRHTPAATKTKQFYQMNSNLSPRFKTNHLPTSGCQELETAVNLSQSTMHLNKPKIHPVSFFPHSVQHPHKSPIKYTSETNVNKMEYSQLNKKKGQSNTSKVPSDEEKSKMMTKAKQIKQLREQMNILGIENSVQAKQDSAGLEKDKSARDLLIKKKVEQKNRKHQDLKSAISKLLQS